MNWNKIRRSLGRGYAWLWGHIEPIKSVLLTFLILFSIFLTWQLWSYTPNLQKLDEGEPIVSSINGEKRMLKDVIQPSKVILHHNGNHYGTLSLTLPDNVKGIYERLQSDAFLVPDNNENEVEASPEWFEIIYPTPIPMPVLQDIFIFSGKNPFSADLGTVKKIVIYKKDNDWLVRFEKSNEGYYDFQITETSSFANVVEDYLNYRVELESFHMDGNDFYLPKKQILVKEYRYQIDKFDIDDYLKFLLPGDTVKIDSLENRVTYSDGKSIVHYYKRQDRFDYKSRSSKSNPDDLMSQPTIIKAVDFVNNHKGWTDDFHLYEYTNIESKYERKRNVVDLQFQLSLEGIPVLGHPISSIELEYTNDELYRYKRSLVDLAYEVGTHEVELKSGEQVMQSLEQLQETNVKDIMFGYSIESPEDGITNASITLEPKWFYKVGSTWLKVEDIKEPLKNKGR
ncbi:YycH family regulatory protein [Alkalihalobacillus sp. AL-G]|uniref:YycH family regulatory protein n=1 Tax=Alkalihalobacillus sp. AL-G TaxID=2926399 RepID=UPI00272A9111|nr:two-component system activity regulator YycH [Alkalihalobacillus sp. AL-G]WLD93366.1 two-component system activity regulator YycH [Alkalihalobacillus sp. AL-G]